VGIKYNRKITWYPIDAIGFGIDNKNISGATLWNVSTETRSWYTTTTTTTIKQQPKTSISTITVGGVKYTESGAWTINAGPSSLNGNVGLYVWANYFSNSGNSIGLSTQHGTIMANAGIDVSNFIAGTINSVLNTQYTTNNVNQQDKLSLLDITAQDSLKIGRLVWLGWIMSPVINTTNSTKVIDTTKPFVVDSTNITKM